MLNPKIVEAGFSSGGQSIFSEEGYKKFEEVCSRVLPRYSDEKVERMCRDIEVCYDSFMPEVSCYKLNRSDLGLVQDEKGNSSIESTLKSMQEVMKNSIENIASKVDNGNFSDSEQTLETLQSIIKAAQNLQSSAQQLKNRTEKLAKLEAGEALKEEEERRGLQSFAGIYSDKSLKYTEYGDEGKQTKYKHPFATRGRSQDITEHSDTEQSLIQYDNNQRVNYLQSAQDLMTMIKDLGDYSLEPRHIKELQGMTESETQLYQTLGPKYLKMKIALSNLLVRTAKEIKEYTQTDGFPKLEEFKVCNEEDGLRAARSSLKIIVEDENFHQHFLTNKIKSPFDVGSLAAVERIGKQLDIVTTQLNGEPLDRFIQYEDGSYMSYQEISEELGNPGYGISSKLSNVSLGYIENYVRVNNITLPQPQQTTNISRK